MSVAILKALPKRKGRPVPQDGRDVLRLSHAAAAEAQGRVREWKVA